VRYCCPICGSNAGINQHVPRCLGAYHWGRSAAFIANIRTAAICGKNWQTAAKVKAARRWLAAQCFTRPSPWALTTHLLEIQRDQRAIRLCDRQRLAKASALQQPRYAGVAVPRPNLRHILRDTSVLSEASPVLAAQHGPQPRDTSISCACTWMAKHRQAQCARDGVHS